MGPSGVPSKSVARGDDLKLEKNVSTAAEFPDDLVLVSYHKLSLLQAFARKSLLIISAKRPFTIENMPFFRPFWKCRPGRLAPSAPPRYATHGSRILLMNMQIGGYNCCTYLERDRKSVV